MRLRGGEGGGAQPLPWITTHQNKEEKGAVMCGGGHEQYPVYGLWNLYGKFRFEILIIKH